MRAIAIVGKPVKNQNLSISKIKDKHVKFLYIKIINTFLKYKKNCKKKLILKVFSEDLYMVKI
jgi:hypothetical protein